MGARTTTSQVHLMMGWREEPTTHPHQLTHAVEAGRRVAACGVQVTAAEGSWPEPGLCTPVAQCQTCRKAVQFLWGGDHRH